ncbi:hypothetical protein M407DRAFT_6611 [Tulasnella calospora MUT 4182]|uniref:Uncharacterized protein n=1 Tax=Tulasnella calospora MUT 4182 TaxID=1051891 RepID=A0A0C3QNJ6_9AGAM|nr:hypothetical protein M407DRAFT_6611 [Tulasnella calospora MUT 4182]
MKYVGESNGLAASGIDQADCSCRDQTSETVPPEMPLGFRTPILQATQQFEAQARMSLARIGALQSEIYGPRNVPQDSPDAAPQAWPSVGSAAASNLAQGSQTPSGRTHFRPRSTNLPTFMPASLRDSPKPVRVVASPALLQRFQPGGNAVGTSPSRSSVNTPSHRRGEGTDSNPPVGQGPNQDPKAAAMFAQSQASEAVRLFGSAEAQQNTLQSRMVGNVPSFHERSSGLTIPQSVDLAGFNQCWAETVRER